MFLYKTKKKIKKLNCTCFTNYKYIYDGLQFQKSLLIPSFFTSIYSCIANGKPYTVIN